MMLLVLHEINHMIIRLLPIFLISLFNCCGKGKKNKAVAVSEMQKLPPTSSVASGPNSTPQQPSKESNKTSKDKPSGEQKASGGLSSDAKADEKDEKKSADAAQDKSKGGNDEEKKEGENPEETKEEKRSKKEPPNKASDDKVIYPSVKEPTPSTKKKREQELEQDKKDKIDQGFYQPRSDEDDTLEKIDSLKMEVSESRRKGASSKKNKKAMAGSKEDKKK